MNEAEMRIVEDLREAEIMSRYYKREATLWKDIAVRLAHAGFCAYCDAHSEMNKCHDPDGWHKAYNDAAARTGGLE